MAETYKQLFIGGDLSGIQNYLYNISSKKAAVSLKGRSAYLRDYMEKTCEDIKQTVKDAGSKTIKELYCSGGKFYIVTDNNAEIVSNLETCITKHQKELWAKHLGELGINISYVPFTENTDGTINISGLTNQEPGILWNIINEGFAKQKSQKFKDILENNYSSFFEAIPVGGNIKVCAVTGIESNDCVKMDNNDEDIFVLRSVNEQIKNGEKLRKEQHFKEFGEYAGNTSLGVLRMDLDNLGSRFRTGFKKISAYCKFSKRLRDFFEIELSNIQKSPKFIDYVNIIYAGGDDLFVIGRWDKTIDFAEQVSQQFRTMFPNEGISISGGIAIVNPKFPIAKAAELAGNAEDAAKQFDGGKKGCKNAFYILGKTVSWNEEFDYVKGYKDTFVNLITKYNLSKGLLHKLMLYSSIAAQNKVLKKEGKTENFSYIWHISYYLTRYMKRYDNVHVRDLCLKLRDKECLKLRDKELDYSNCRNLELIALAARWAELILKDNNV